MSAVGHDRRTRDVRPGPVTPAPVPLSKSQRKMSRTLLLLMVVTSLALVSVDKTGFGPLDSLRRRVLDVTAPVRDFVGAVVGPVGDLWDAVTSHDELERENRMLRRRVEELEGAALRGEAASDELARLSAELDLFFVEELDRVVARVVAGPVDPLSETVEIDKGTSQGIREGMPVVNAKGLVGSVERAGRSRSRIRLVTDPTYRVAVRLSRSSDAGVARGQGAGRPLVIEAGIDPDTEVRRGELVVTSGLERTRTPGGIPVGRVASSVRVRGDLDQEVYVEPSAPVSALDYVTVLVWTPSG
ncbi:MAG: cell shape-determining protein MreC [Acidimicrobiales bacterium]|nr:MAG: cell shape-determining protein MreC [Acidimicrobiales bacterium]